MPAYTDKQYVELFHLLFLAQLGTKVDKRHYALKGGCNLRFFLKSPRFSEDMDLDTAKELPVVRLQERVDGILKSKPFAQILAARGMQIEHINSDKQTNTVQKWKLLLRVTNIESPLNTKVEFSRRGMGSEVAFEAIDPNIVGSYQLGPVLASHYPRQSAYQQKLSALIDRKETQARDIFDIHLLLTSGVDSKDVPKKIRDRIEDAKANVEAIEFIAFKGQVLAYLPQDIQATYDRKVWDDMRIQVLETLEGISP